MYVPYVAELLCAHAKAACLPASAVLYAFSIAYIVAPDTFASANVVELVSGLPEALKYAGKLILAGPFAFHFLNGLRHLSWDMGKCEFPTVLLCSYIDLCMPQS